MSLLVELLIDPITHYGFMRVGLIAATLVGVTSAVLSCLLVIRGEALLGDAVSHAVLLGVVVGYLFGGQLGIPIGAMIVAVLTGAGITLVTQVAPFRADTAMGVLFTVTFALGLAIISIVQPRGIDLFHILFGNVLGVRTSDLIMTATIGTGVLLLIVGGFRAFQLWAFDPQLARAMGMRTNLIHHLFTTLLAATIVASLQTVGLILVVAMLVIPGATAAMVTNRLNTMMIVAAAVGTFSATAGLYGSFYLEVASGPAIVLVAGACFATAFLLAPRGLLAHLRPPTTSDEHQPTQQVD